MKKRLTALALALVFLLSGCTAMLERDYVTVEQHVEYHVDEDHSALQAESYQALVSALLYFVGEHAETGVVHLSNYVGEVGADVKRACAEIMEEDPLGAYALEDIEHTHTRIVSYYEVNFTFRYARTEAEMEAVRTVSGVPAMLRLVGNDLTDFRERSTFSLNWFYSDEVTLLTEVRQLWLDKPLTLVEPEVLVKLYPGSGPGRIIEFSFRWPEDTTDLSARSSAALAAAQRLLQDLNLPDEELTAQRLAAALTQRVTPDEETGGDSAYDALVTGTANRRGMTMALRLLCDLAGVEATVVEGRLADGAAWWLIVHANGEYRHLDPAAPQQELCTDGTFRALDYEWSTERYPACEGEEEPPVPDEPVEDESPDAPGEGENPAETP